MSHEQLSIPTRDGDCPAHLFKPRGLGPWPAVIFYMDGLGIRPDGTAFHPKGRGDGYVLNYGGKNFYFAGDTEGTPEMRALKDIDVAFIPMNLPYTMTPGEAADAVKAFHPKVAIPYHYKGQDITIFRKDLEGSGVEVRLLDWYANAIPSKPN